MNNMISFSARGTKFSIPRPLLKKYPDTLLNNICIYDNIPVDKINDDIFVDINPSNISMIIELYHYRDLNKLKIKSISQYMDIRFLGFDVEYDKISPYMINPLVYDNPDTNHLTGTLSHKTDVDGKMIYVNIHTSDNNKIIIHKNIVDGWIECHFKSIILGQIDDYIIDRGNDYIDIWIGINTFKTHYMLSVLRDGINYYYYDYPLRYTENMNNIVCDIDTENIKKIGCSEDNICLYYRPNRNYFDKFTDEGRRDGEYYSINGAYYHLGEEYLKLQNNCDIGNEIPRIIAIVDFNFELSNREIEGVIDSIKSLGKSHKKIAKCVTDIENTICEYHITHELLYFFGLLNDDIKKQLEDRIQI